jgi:low temperature requirement protein LtrA
MAFAFVLRWWYFDVAESAATRHVRSRRQATLFQIWHYAHLPMFLGIGIAGVGFERMISLNGEEHLSGGAGWILCSAVALLMAALIGIGATSETAQQSRGRAWQVAGQLAAVGVVGALGAGAAGMHRVVLVVTLVGICTVQTMLGRAATT